MDYQIGRFVEPHVLGSAYFGFTHPGLLHRRELAQGIGPNDPTEARSTYQISVPPGCNIFSPVSGIITKLNQLNDKPIDPKEVHNTNYVEIKVTNGLSIRLEHIKTNYQVGEQVKEEEFLGEVFGYLGTPHIHLRATPAGITKLFMPREYQSRRDFIRETQEGIIRKVTGRSNWRAQQQEIGRHNRTKIIQEIQGILREEEYLRSIPKSPLDLTGTDF